MFVDLIFSWNATLHRNVIEEWVSVLKFVGINLSIIYLISCGSNFIQRYPFACFILVEVRTKFVHFPLLSWRWISSNDIIIWGYLLVGCNALLTQISHLKAKEVIGRSHWKLATFLCVFCLLWYSCVIPKWKRTKAKVHIFIYS